MNLINKVVHYIRFFIKFYCNVMLELLTELDYN